MIYYPLFLDLHQMSCLVVGGGQVGLRKAQGLVTAQARNILVLNAEPFDAHWHDMDKNTSVRLECRPFSPADIEGRQLVFACTGCRESNARIAALCASANILCNCVDAPHEGNCIVPATVRPSLPTPINVSDTTDNNTKQKNKIKNSALHTISDKGLTVAISTGGASPAWARVLRHELDDWLGPRQAMTLFMGRLRPLVLALGEDTRHNTLLFRELVHSPLRDALAKSDKEQAQEILQRLLPETLHPYMTELLYDII